VIQFQPIRKMYSIPEMCRNCRERGMAGPLSTGEQKGCKAAAAGSHSATLTGKATCERNTDRKPQPRDGEREVISFGIRHDGSQFYPLSLHELLISRFSVT